MRTLSIGLAMLRLRRHRRDAPTIAALQTEA
jgi:hypothetical protein